MSVHEEFRQFCRRGIVLEILKVRLADTDTIGNIDAVVGSNGK